MTTSLLIDADIVAYKFAATAQQPNPFDIDGEPLVEDLGNVCKEITSYLEGLLELLDAQNLVICLSDSRNFRKTVLPSYKANRAGLPKPVLLGDVRAWIEQSYPCFKRPWLEADDVMGILSTNKAIITHRKIIVSEDKDMQQIPGLLFNPNKDTEVREITVEQADHFHMMQTLTGDPVDGYKGCPGIGPKKAEKILAEQCNFDAVVVAFESKGLTKEDALVQARVSRICRSSDYDFIKKEPILWSPPTT